MNVVSSMQNDPPYLEEVSQLIRQTLQLPDDYVLDVDTKLLGSIAEFDSMSVVTVLTGIEELFGIFVEDDEISAETFESLGTLLGFVQSKTAA